MITKALINRAIAAMEKTGRPVKAIRLEPNGSVVLLTEGLVVDASATPNDDWIALAGKTRDDDTWAVDSEKLVAAQKARTGRGPSKRQLTKSAAPLSFAEAVKKYPAKPRKR